MLKLLPVFFLLLLPSLGHAQAYNSYQNQALLDDAMTDIYTVAGSGLAGTILGLSTLSFAENPGDRLKNVVTGGALGIIVGVAIVASSQANKSQNLLAISQKSPWRPSQGYFDRKNNPWRYANRIMFHFSF